MSEPELGIADARRVVEARLGRPPQDMLEAAVVLEAWGGVPAREALETGGAMLRRETRAPLPSAGVVPAAADQQGVAVEALAFVVVILAVGGWAAPLVDALGVAMVEQALLVALPLTMALQWAFSSRYLSRPQGLAHLRGNPLTLVGAAVLVVLGPGLVLGQDGIVAGLLTLTWTGGAVLIRRRWATPYAAIVVLAAVGMLAGVWPPAILAVTAIFITGGVTLAALTSGERPVHRPGRWGRAGSAAAIGLGLGLLLVIDRSISWSLGFLPALALLPSTLAGFWSGTYLWRFQLVIPRVLSGVALRDADAARLGRVPLQILLGAVARLAIGSTSLSLVLLGATSLVGEPVHGATVLVGFGLLALATLLVGLLESVGRGWAAIAALTGGLAVDTAVALQGGPDIAGGGLLLGAAATVSIAFPVAVAVLVDPVTTLATRLHIP